MENLVLLSKTLTQSLIDEIKALPVNVRSFEDADRWVGIVMTLTMAMNPPQAESKSESIQIPIEQEETENG